METPRGIESWASVLNLTFRTTGTAELTAVRTGRTLPPVEIPWYSFLLEGIERLKISNDPTGNGDRSLPSCGLVLPQNAPPFVLRPPFTKMRTA